MCFLLKNLTKLKRNNYVIFEPNNEFFGKIKCPQKHTQVKIFSSLFYVFVHSPNIG
jgi:hypothetical protein